jgi:hypothetical protein
MSIFFFLFHICGGHVDSSIFCFTAKSNCIERNIKYMANQIYINEFLLYKSSCASPFSATRPGGPVQMTYVARLYNTIRPRGLVQKDCVARLAQDLLNQPNPWRGWESCHRVWHDSWNGTSHARHSGMTGAVPIVLNALWA